MNSGTISWAVANWDTGLPASFATVVTPVGATPLLDGEYLVTGLPVRFPANSYGTWSAVMLSGNYKLSLEGQPKLGDIYFAVSDSGSYAVADIRISGGNTFAVTGVRKLTSNDGSVVLTPTNGAGVVDLSANPVFGSLQCTDLTVHGFSEDTTIDRNGDFSSSRRVSCVGISIAPVITDSDLDMDGLIASVVIASLGGITITLPHANSEFQSAGAIITVKGVQQTNTVTVAAQSGETIDGNSTYALTTSYHSVTVISDRTRWLIIGKV